MQISSSYLKEKAYVIPSEVNPMHKDYYKDLSEPTVMDYKNLNGVTWDDLETDLKTSKFRKVSLHLRDTKLNMVKSKHSYSIEFRFRVH